MKRLLIGASLAVVLTAQSSNPRRPLWAQLTPGPYEVGFQVAYYLDRSRVWDPSADSIYNGRFARPIRISMWYPARPARSARPMPYRGYLYRTAAPNSYFRRLDAMLQRADIPPMHDFIFHGSDSLFQRLLSTPTAAYADAPAASGPFPLIAYSAGYNNRSHDNSVLAEYLASHGFVVITVPQLGTVSTRLMLRINTVDLETQTRDLEFAIGEAQTRPFVDRRKLGVMGYSMGGVVGLLLASRNPRVDAIVGLDPSIRAPRFVDLVLRAPQYDPRNIRARFMTLQSGNAREASAQDSTVLLSLRFSDRYIALIDHAAHGDFSDFAAYADLFGLDVQQRTPAESRESFTMICRYVVAFLKGDSLPIRHIPRLDVPSERDLASLVVRRGYERAHAALMNAISRYPQSDIAVVDQAILNRLGYGLVEQGDAMAAVGVFKLNIDTHPNSADAYDSYAEGLLAAGDTSAAVKAYQQLLIVLPTDSSLNAETKEEYRLNTQTKLQTLGPHP